MTRKQTLMKPARYARVAVAAAVVVWVGGTVWAQHHHPAPASQPHVAKDAAAGEQALKVGKKDDVDFDVRTAVGDMTLEPGRYRLQHRVDGADHFVHFTEVTKDIPHHSGTGGGAAKAHPGEVKCRLEPLDKKASVTRVYRRVEGEGARVTRVIIRGENAAHLFE